MIRAETDAHIGGWVSRRRGMLAWLAGGLVCTGLLAVAGWGLVHAETRAGTSLIGRHAPDLTISPLNGGQLSLRSLRGTPIVLNFWASWCVACRQEAPVLAEAARRTAGTVQFIGVDMKDTDAGARAYEAEVRSPYPVGPAVRGSYIDFGVTAPPETIFINREGVVVSRILGPVDAHRLTIYMSQIP